jgi:hypothetical protein
MFFRSQKATSPTTTLCASKNDTCANLNTHQTDRFANLNTQQPDRFDNDHGSAPCSHGGSRRASLYK